MEALGLVELGNEGIARVVHGGDPFSYMWIKTWQRIDDGRLSTAASSAKARYARCGKPMRTQPSLTEPS